MRTPAAPKSHAFWWSMAHLPLPASTKRSGLRAEWVQVYLTPQDPAPPGCDPAHAPAVKP